MKINNSFNKTDDSTNLQSFRGVPPNKVHYYPEKLANLGKIAGEYISAPEQKMFMATTALMLQPLIDLKFADDDKKVDTAIKSASKSIAGGFTGVVIRAAFIKLASKFIDINKRNKLSLHFLPPKAIEDYVKDPLDAQIKLKQYHQSIGTLFAILFMVCFSNSKVDVPLTSDIQDLISGVVKEDKTWIKSLSDVVVNRKKKITTKIDKWKNEAFKIYDKYKKVEKFVSEKLPKKEKKEGSKC